MNVRESPPARNAFANTARFRHSDSRIIRGDTARSLIPVTYPTSGNYIQSSTTNSGAVPVRVDAHPLFDKVREMNGGRRVQQGDQKLLYKCDGLRVSLRFAGKTGI